MLALILGTMVGYMIGCKIGSIMFVVVSKNY
jgi:hypothetical protein